MTVPVTPVTIVLFSHRGHREKMFYRFTDRARKVMTLAYNEVKINKSPYVDTEHMLLGLLEEGTGVGILALKKCGIHLDALQIELKQKLKSKIYTAHKDTCLKRNFINIFRNMLSRYIATSLKGKEIINKSISVSKKLNHNYVGTEHLLLTLIIIDSPVSQILRDKGLSYEKLVETILIVLGEKKEPEKKD